MPSSSIAERVAQQRRESANPVLDYDTRKLLEYRQLLRDPKHIEIWTKAGANEFGQLAQGVGGRIDGTNTIFFIHKHEIPQDRLKDVTYIKIVPSIRVVSRLVMYRTSVLMYRTIVLLARPTKVRR